MASSASELERIRVSDDRRRKHQPPYHVIILDDDDHTYEYVIDLLRQLFAISDQEAYLKAVEVDTTSRAIVDTTTKERAELKRDQIHAYGRDWRIDCCKGSMTALIEPSVV